MSTEAWIAEHEERRMFAARLQTDPGAEVFRSWAFASHPDLCAAALHALANGPNRATPAWLLGPAPTARAPRTRRMHCREAEAGTTTALAGQIAFLDWLGREVEDRERRTWSQDYASHPEDDHRAGSIWAGLIHGDPWSVRAPCEEHWLPTVERVFRGVLAGRELPRDVRTRVMADLRDGFFFRLLGPEHPGWKDIAVRVLETLSPLAGPGAALPPHQRLEAAACVSRRGAWAATLEQLLPNRPDQDGRAQVAAAWFEDPTRFEALIDLHVVLRLLQRGPVTVDAAWRIVTQNRGRARGRLRALLCQSSDWNRLFDVPALAMRTDAALARWAWAWSWQELAHDFSFDGGRALTPLCTASPEGVAPLDSTSTDAVAVWVLLVVFKGRLPHLRRWITQGGTGDRDSTWARLQRDLPPIALDPDGKYRRVRIHLADHLDPMLHDHLPLLNQLATLEPGRKLKSNFLKVLSGCWHPQIPVPKSGFPTFQNNICSTITKLQDMLP